MLPEEFQRRMRRLLGETEYQQFLAAGARPRAAALRRNPAKPVKLPDWGLTPVPWATDGFYYDAAARPGLSPLHDAGAYYLQEASAMAPAALLGAGPGMRVLDLCAAPGGKSTQLAAAMEGEGILVSNEIHPKRARILARNLERMGAANAVVLGEHPRRLAERFSGWFDRVLVDAPCSGEGMFRKEEAAVADWSVETVEMCARRQREILASAAAMVRPGGLLVYSTCTFAPEENEGVVSAFLHEHPEFSVTAVAAPWFAPGRPDWVENPAPGLENTFRLWPHRLRGEGHFAALLRRRDGGERADLPAEPPVPAPRELVEFRRATGAVLPAGRLIRFGAGLYLAPEELPPLRGLRVVRPGLELGEARKGRFLPAHAWAMWPGIAAAAADFPADGPAAAAYLAGEIVPGGLSGWGLLRAGGLALGWVKGDGATLKNHLPKGLRRVAKPQKI